MCAATPLIPAATFEFLWACCFRVRSVFKCRLLAKDRERLTLSWLRSTRVTIRRKRVLKWQTEERGYSYIDARMKQSHLRQKQQHDSTVTGHATHNYTVRKVWVSFSLYSFYLLPMHVRTD